MSRGDPSRQCITRLLSNFELHRTLRFLLHDDRAVSHMTSLLHIMHAEANQIAAAQFAIDGQIE
jgi:hypothetical protein